MPRPRRRPRWPSDPPEPLDLTARQMDDLRATQLDLLREFDRVCRHLGLEYFALYGTALGAIRHGGFIPWDDDLDLGMLRPDYDRLSAAIAAEVGDAYLWQTVDTDPHYGYQFGKLRRRGTRCVDRDSFGSAQHSGVFIDVFPVDAKATGLVTRPFQKLMRYAGFFLIYAKAGYHFGSRTAATRFARRLFRELVGLTPRRVIVAMSTWASRVGRTARPAEYVGLYGGYLYDRDTMAADWIHPLRTVAFEDVTIPVFADTEAYLEQIYGDWRRLPPEEERFGRHELVELEI